MPASIVYEIEQFHEGIQIKSRILKKEANEHELAALHELHPFIRKAFSNYEAARPNCVTLKASSLEAPLTQAAMQEFMDGIANKILGNEPSATHTVSYFVYESLLQSMMSARLLMGTQATTPEAEYAAVKEIVKEFVQDAGLHAEDREKFRSLARLVFAWCLAEVDGDE